MQISRHLAGAAVLELDLGFNELGGRTAIQRIDQRQVFVGNEAAPDLVGAGQLTIVGVQLFVQDQETGHLAAGQHAVFGQIGIDFFNQLAHGQDAIAHHHDPDNAATLYAVLVAAADALSAARPGARRESIGEYLQRLEALERIALSFPGVETAFAVQAGREVRVIVKPEKISDAKATLLAREIASRIEKEMNYPGQVQVTVVRETRAVEYAR